MTHEISMVSHVRKFLQQNKAKRILIAVSGGVDSIVLTSIVSKLYDVNNVAVVSVDHDLRPESHSEINFVADFCQKIGVKFFQTLWHHPEGDVGIEASGRKFRYDFFEQVMEQGSYDTLLTAHHANDLSENILMKMIRSGNVYEVTSLKEKRLFANGQLLRPLLSFSKQDIRQYAQKHDLKFVQDQTNFENITMRNRLRNEVFPKLQQENGQLLNHFELFDQQLNALLDLSSQVFDSIEQQMDLLQQNKRLTGKLMPVNQLTAAQQSLFWGRLFTRRFPELSISNKQIKQIIDISQGNKPNASLNLEGGWHFYRKYDGFEFSHVKYDQDLNVLVKLGHSYQVGSREFSIVESTPEEATFSVAEMPKQIILRTRRNGDKLVINHSQHQKLSKRFINQKIPEEQRKILPILLFDNEIVWVEKTYNISDYLNKRKLFFKINFNEVKK